LLHRLRTAPRDEIRDAIVLTEFTAQRFEVDGLAVVAFPGIAVDR
jgi:hypothetical protein